MCCQLRTPITRAALVIQCTVILCTNGVQMFFWFAGSSVLCHLCHLSVSVCVYGGGGGYSVRVG